MYEGRKLYKGTFTIDGEKNDLNYLEGQVSNSFNKIFHFLSDIMKDENVRKKFTKEAISLVDKIINNNFSDKDKKLSDLRRVIRPEANSDSLTKALDELNNILNSNNNSELFEALKRRALNFNHVQATDEVTKQFIDDYSKPYLIELFDAKKQQLKASGLLKEEVASNNPAITQPSQDVEQVKTESPELHSSSSDEDKTIKVPSLPDSTLPSSKGSSRSSSGDRQTHQENVNILATKIGELTQEKLNLTQDNIKLIEIKNDQDQKLHDQD